MPSATPTGPTFHVVTSHSTKTTIRLHHQRELDGDRYSLPPLTITCEPVLVGWRVTRATDLGPTAPGAALSRIHWRPTRRSAETLALRLALSELDSGHVLTRLTRDRLAASRIAAAGA